MNTVMIVCEDCKRRLPYEMSRGPVRMRLDAFPVRVGGHLPRPVPPYRKVDLRLIRHASMLGLDDRRLRLVLLLMSYEREPGQWVFPLQDTLAKHLGLSRETVGRNLTWLADNGLLRKRPRKPKPGAKNRGPSHKRPLEYNLGPLHRRVSGSRRKPAPRAAQRPVRVTLASHGHHVTLAPHGAGVTQK